MPTWAHNGIPETENAQHDQLNTNNKMCYELWTARDKNEQKRKHIRVFFFRLSFFPEEEEKLY